MKKIISLVVLLAMTLTLFSAFAEESIDKLASDEISVIGATVEASSVNENNGKPTEVPEWAIDGKLSTHWHTMINPKAEGPHWITITLPKAEIITGYRYYSREQGAAGICTKYEIHVSADGMNFTKVAEGTWDNQNNTKTAHFDAVTAKAVKLVMLEANGGFGSAGEIRLIGAGSASGVSVNTDTSSNTTAGTSASEELSVEGVTLQASSVNENNGKPSEVPEWAIDGKLSTHWITMINPKAEAPHWITMELPEATAVYGYRYYPRPNGASGTCTRYEIHTSADGTSFTKTAEGTWANNDTAKTVYFSKAVVAKAFKLVILEGSNGFGSAAEIRLLGKKGENTENENTEQKNEGQNVTPGELGDEITPLNWKFEASSINENNGVPWEEGKYTVDGDLASHWHTMINPKAEGPHHITVIFPKTEIISGYRYYPRATGNAGICTKYEIWVSADGENYTKEAEGTWESDRTAKTAYFKENVAAKKVKLVLLEATDGYGSAGEIRVLKKDASKPLREGVAEGDPTVLADDENPVAGWTFDTSSTNGNNGKLTEVPEWTVDGNLDTHWHTMINPKAEGPHYITAIFPKEEYISGFRYYPRGKGTPGICKEYEIHVSSDGVNFTKVSEGEWIYDKTTKESDFFINIKAKAVKLVILNGEAGYGSAGEIRTLKAKANYDNVDAATYEKDIEQYKIKPVLFDSMKVRTSLDDKLKAIPGLISDGEIQSLWETTALDKSYLGPPVDIDYEFGYPYTIKGIEYVPRQDGQWHGRGHFKTFEVYTSENGTDYTLFETITLENTDDNNTKYIFFKEEINTKYLRFRVLECRGAYAAAAEIRFLQTEGQNRLENILDEETYILKIGSKDILVKRGNEEKVVTTDVAPYIYNGSTMIPLRGLLTEMGASINWNGDIQRIDVKSKMGDMVFEIESFMVYIDEVRYTCPVAPQITEGRTFIPLRFVSENLGYNVYWNGETQEIKISNK